MVRDSRRDEIRVAPWPSGVPAPPQGINLRRHQSGLTSSAIETSYGACNGVPQAPFRNDIESRA